MREREISGEAHHAGSKYHRRFVIRLVGDALTTYHHGSYYEPVVMFNFTGGDRLSPLVQFKPSFAMLDSVGVIMD